MIQATGTKRQCASEDINAAVVVEDNNINASVVVVESAAASCKAVCLQEKIIFLVDMTLRWKVILRKKHGWK